MKPFFLEISLMHPLQPFNKLLVSLVFLVCLCFVVITLVLFWTKNGLLLFGEKTLIMV